MDVSAVAPSIAPLGMLLRMRRRELGITQGEVAERAGRSVGFISQVERGLTLPSLSSMLAIAEALGKAPGDFLHQPTPPDVATHAAGRRRYSLTKEAREKVEYERLSSVFPGSTLHSVLFRLPPGYAAETVAHAGEEMVYVVSGSLAVSVDKKRYELGPGDSAHFGSRRPHRYLNTAGGTTVVLYVGTLGLFG